MRYPLWALNSTLFVLVISALLFIAFSREDLPEREEIEPSIVTPLKKDGVSIINLKQIYENDLFGTYEKEVVITKEPKYIVPLPEPPSPVRAKIPKKERPKFLDPLQITLKGIMSVSDGVKNKAIIEDNKTKREEIYKVGDKFGDAQLIRIFNNKIIFVRSNGQQEVFYLRQDDAKEDPTYLIISDWNGVVRKIAPNNYRIYFQEFSKRIKNLAQFIDILNLTTAYKKGKSVGCRIGSGEARSLAKELGLEVGDIILTINGIPATDTKNRLKIYKEITTASLDDVITVRLQRKKRTYTLRYKIADFSIIKKPSEPGQAITSHYIEKEQKKMIEKKHTFAPTVREIRKKERQNMFKKGKKPNNYTKN
ncbi:hypothetical protein KAH94_06645 [bacterium]|nr:hypothetical protein [bacterium]